MEPSNRDLERLFYADLKPVHAAAPRELHAPEGTPPPVGPKSADRRDGSLLLFFLTYVTAAAFCGLVLYYQFSLLPEHRVQRAKLHSVNDRAMTLRAKLYELFFLQQDFLNQELVAKLPPKDAVVREFLAEVEKISEAAFSQDAADPAIRRDFAASFGDFRDLWLNAAERAVGGDPEGAQFDFLSQEASLRASMLASVESQIDALSIGFRAADKLLDERQAQFKNLIYCAGVAFLFLFLREMATYFRYRRNLRQADFDDTTSTASHDLGEFEDTLESLQRIFARINEESAHKRQRIDELTKLIEPLIDFERKYKDRLRERAADVSSGGDPHPILSEFLRESHHCMMQLWENLASYQGPKDAQILTLGDWQGDRELQATVEKLDRARKKVERIVAAMILRRNLDFEDSVADHPDNPDTRKAA